MFINPIKKSFAILSRLIKGFFDIALLAIIIPILFAALLIVFIPITIVAILLLAAIIPTILSISFIAIIMLIFGENQESFIELLEEIGDTANISPDISQ